MSGIVVRPEVQWFAEQMELALQRNDWKGGWERSPYMALLQSMAEEVEEVRSVLIRPKEVSAVAELIQEAADVANFAMMLADNANNGRHNQVSQFFPTHSDLVSFF